MVFSAAYRFIQIKQPDGGTIIKLFLAGPYEDSWTFNSGCLSIEEDGNTVLVHGYSGSVYRINKDCEGILTNFTSRVLEDILETLGDYANLVDYEYVKEKLK